VDPRAWLLIIVQDWFGLRCLVVAGHESKLAGGWFGVSNASEATSMAFEDGPKQGDRITKDA